MTLEIAVGSLIAVPSRYSGGMWLFRVTGETPQRWLVEVVTKPDRWAASPAVGNNKPYFDKASKQPILVRDETHFAEIVAAYAEYQQALDAAKDAHREACKAAEEAYRSAIA